MEILEIDAWYWVVGVLVVGLLLLRWIMSYKSEFNVVRLFWIALFFAIIGTAGFALWAPLALVAELQGMQFEPKEWTGWFQFNLIGWSFWIVISFVVFQVARHKFTKTKGG